MMPTSLSRTRRGLAVAAASVAALIVVAAPAAAFDLNSFRAEHKLPRLHRSPALANAAYAHARDLASRRELDHDGFRLRMSGYSMAAENVAYGCASETCVMRMWARSPGHRRNMLMKGLRHYGLASARAANGQTYWVLDMGN